MEWLTEGDGSRMRVALWSWGTATVLAGIARKQLWARALLHASCLVIAFFGLVTAALGILMERELAIAVAMSVGLYSWLSRNNDSGRGARLPALLLAGVASGASLYYVYALFMTDGSGYPFLRGLGNALRGGEVGWRSYWMVAVGAIGATALAVHRPALRRFGLALVPGLAVASLVSLPAALVLIPSSVALAGLLLPQMGSLRGPMAWPARLAVPCILAGFLLGHTYSARVLACPSPEDPRLQRLATPGETFRIAANDRGVLGLSLRGENRIGRLDVSGASATLSHAASGPLAPDWTDDITQLYGAPEELVFAPSSGRFFGTVTPARPGDWGEPGQGPIHNLIFALDDDLNGVEDAFGIPGLCWVNTLHWSDSEGLLYIGCEEVPGLHRYDPDHSGLVDGQSDGSLGDVQDLAFGAGKQEGKLFSISLWRSDQITELDRDTLKILRQSTIGGTHYHLAYDPVESRLYSSAYYGGRVHIVDADTLELVDSLRAGFGVREVVVDPTRRLLLASNTYDGELRYWNLGTEGKARPGGAIRVGGHVKDIHVSSATGQAWLWSQCGVYELDLDSL